MQCSGVSATLQGTPKLYTTSVKLHTNTVRSYRLHGTRLQSKQTRAAAVQKSQQLAERVPASSVAQEVRSCYLAGCCSCYLLAPLSSGVKLLLLCLVHTCVALVKTARFVYLFCNLKYSSMLCVTDGACWMHRLLVLLTNPSCPNASSTSLMSFSLWLIPRSATNCCSSMPELCQHWMRPRRSPPTG